MLVRDKSRDFFFVCLDEFAKSKENLGALSQRTVSPSYKSARCGIDCAINGRRISKGNALGDSSNGRVINITTALRLSHIKRTVNPMPNLFHRFNLLQGIRMTLITSKRV